MTETAIKALCDIVKTAECNFRACVLLRIAKNALEKIDKIKSKKDTKNKSL